MQKTLARIANAGLHHHRHPADDGESLQQPRYRRFFEVSNRRAARPSDPDW
jgi:hypothetical protein